MSINYVNHVFPVTLSPTQPIFKATLPLVPPGINTSYQVVDGPRRVACTSKAARFKKDAALLLSQHSIYDYSLVNAIRDAATRKRGGRKTPLQFIITFYFPTLWKRDGDGGLKIAQDAVFKYLGLNDNLIVDWSIRKKADREHPRVEVEVRCFVQQ